jgi:hypothetical protein
MRPGRPAAEAAEGDVSADDGIRPAKRVFSEKCERIARQLL